MKGKPNSVILRLYDFNEKLDFIRNARKSKVSQVFISEDFTRRVQLVRKDLWNNKKRSRKPKYKVSLHYDKLILNREVYIWDESTHQRMKISSPVSTQESESYLLPRKHAVIAASVSKLKVLLINCHSIKNKITDFTELVATTQPSIVLGTESWPTEAVAESEGFLFGWFPF